MTEGTNRISVVILGRTIGTASGWDEVGDFDLYFYDFVPDGRTVLTRADLAFSVETGVIESVLYDGEEDRKKIFFSGDVVSVLRDVPPDGMAI